MVLFFFRPLAVPFVKIFFASQTDRSGSTAFGGGTPPPPFALRYMVMLVLYTAPARLTGDSLTFKDGTGNAERTPDGWIVMMLGLGASCRTELARKQVTMGCTRPNVTTSIGTAFYCHNEGMIPTETRGVN